VDQFERELPLFRTAAAVMFVDVVESVRLVQQDEQGAVQRIRALLANLAKQSVPACGGQVVQRMGDGLLLQFAQARQAVECATALHHQAQVFNAQLPADQRLWLRAGMHFAELLTDASALYGLGVNLAARITALAGPGETVVSADARDQLVNGLDGEYLDLGDCHLKHLREPVRLFKHIPKTAPCMPRPLMAQWSMQPTLLVMPLQAAGADALAGGPLARGVADVVTDQLTRCLSRTPLLNLISSLSADAFRGRHVAAQPAAQAVGADYVLRGQVHQEGGRVRIQVSLWRARGATPLCELDLPGTLSDLLAPDSSCLGQVVQQIGRCMLAVELRLGGARALPNLASHTLYLNAVSALHRFSSVQFNRAHDMLQVLAERAPRHPEPLAWLARWHVFRVVQGWTHEPAADSARALDYSHRALDRDPESALALTMAGSVHAGVRRDPETARSYYDQALAHNPNEPLAWLMKGVAHGFLDDKGPAVQSSGRALALSPLDPMHFYYDSLSATAHVWAGDYAQGMVLARRAIAANSAHGSAYRALAVALAMTGALQEAQQVIGELLAVEPQSSVSLYLARVGVLNAQNLLFADALRRAGLPEN